MIISEKLINNITHIHGEKGRQWLNDLPALLSKFEKAWNLKLGDCYVNASFNYVAPVAIDPKGVIGEREYEIPLPRLENILDNRLLQRRLDCFITFSGFDRQKIIRWLFSKAVLAAWWTFQDSGVADKKFIQCAKVVEKMLISKTHSSSKNELDKRKA